ncbi:DUF1302 domain-containing protein [Pseudomonas sp. GCM10022188]|uniref:DUF1302 domain-containing protein n=1 Tax=Pseudomonas TaxID=286 RepID=UPI001E374A89|nr:DUF1302 domain-containing protein [Pseudomonas oryzagri]MCC6075113.1 DUF1302 domain-containing protein [Pseudomonas oryzagri]
MQSTISAIRKVQRHPGVRQRALAIAVAAAIGSPACQAFMIETDNPDVKVLWDTTAKYSSAFRVEDQSARLTREPQANWPNTDDGDRNFDKGLISNRLDVLTELDFSYRQRYGFRVSAAAWYDSEYHGSNDNDSPATANPLSVDYNEFPQDTRELHGGDAEVLDAFVFGRFDLGSMPLTARLGKHTMLWGESLFYGANGIANAQAPIDVVKAQSVPNTQFKELMRPVNQVSGQLQLTPDVALGAYYQLEWENTLLPGAGSYFSGVDFLSEGGERMLLASDGSVYFQRAGDLAADDSGQGGVQLRFRVGEVDYGLYAVRYHDKTPQIYLLPGVDAGPTASGVRAGYYRWVYPENIRAFGFSASRTFGMVNLAGEVSIRRDTPLNSDAQVDATGSGDGDDNALYAVGNSVHAQINWLASLGPSFIAREADFLGEIAWNRRTSVTQNESALNPNASRDASNIRMVYEPKYRQVYPGLDLSVPVGVGYGLDGNSSVVGAFLGEHVGDFNIGLNGTYLDVWRFGVSYTHYFGPVDNAIDSEGHGSYKQNLADRDFVAVTLRRTF